MERNGPEFGVSRTIMASANTLSVGTNVDILQEGEQLFKDPHSSKVKITLNLAF